ncbi:MAG: tetratricopeptide repeat protein [Gemmatimonadales bacterium]
MPEAPTDHYGLPTVLTAFIAALVLLTSCGPREDGADFVGRAVCAECHQTEFELWTGSHHDLAMQVADETTVLGDFNDATFMHFGVTSTFFRRDGRFVVRTDGPDGELREYEVAYTFGITPLQQYLIKFPNGRYQALSVMWDTRPVEEGGQRWFHLYPGEPIPFDDELHWTGRNQNWNYMCAECHSTDLRKNYSLEEDAYQTTWAEIDVSCEACHGPGSDHVAWATGAPEERYGETNGLALLLSDTNGGAWEFDPGARIAHRTRRLDSQTQIATCARCHSRRSSIVDHYEYGRPLLDTHAPRVLEQGLYHVDGQILDEVYVYGSFRQSKMFGAGVTCSDCHDPHSLNGVAERNALCAKCHLATVFDTPQHHKHAVDSQGARCIECHMPSATYMVVDLRRDHSFRIPRPDLSQVYDTPNPCNECHGDRSSDWAAQTMDRWYGTAWRERPQYADVIYSGRVGLPTADAGLAELVQDTTVPSIVRATAVSLLRSYRTPTAAKATGVALSDSDPLVRLQAVSLLDQLPPEQRLGHAFELIGDSIRAVRIEAARMAATVPSEMLTPATSAIVDTALQEYVAAQLANSDRALSHLNLGVLHTVRGEYQQAEEEYRTALRLEPRFVVTYVNFADLYRMLGRDDEGESLLRHALEIAPENATAHHALGLLLTRQNRIQEAVESLRRAVELAPDNARFSFVHAVAVNSTGDVDGAISLLETAHELHPYDRSILIALATFNQERGTLEDAVRYANRLVFLYPLDAEASQLLEDLQSMQDQEREEPNC